MGATTGRSCVEVYYVGFTDDFSHTEKDSFIMGDTWGDGYD